MDDPACRWQVLHDPLPLPCRDEGHGIPRRRMQASQSRRGYVNPQKRSIGLWKKGNTFHSICPCLSGTCTQWGGLPKEVHVRLRQGCLRMKAHQDPVKEEKNGLPGLRANLSWTTHGDDSSECTFVPPSCPIPSNWPPGGAMCLSHRIAAFTRRAPPCESMPRVARWPLSRSP